MILCSNYFYVLFVQMNGWICILLLLLYNKLRNKTLFLIFGTGDLSLNCLAIQPWRALVINATPRRVFLISPPGHYLPEVNGGLCATDEKKKIDIIF